MCELPSIETLRATLEYDSDTGNLFFKERPDVRACWNARLAGKRAMSTLGGDGYFRGYLFSKMTLAHRIAYALHTGNSQFGFVDHINGIRSDNRACNLREVSRGENAQNKARPQNSTSGHIGVSPVDEVFWRAHITTNNRTQHLGRFRSIDEAIAARKAAEVRLGFHQNHGRDLFIEGAAA